MTEFLETRKDGRFFHICINRPSKRNAINSEMYTKLAEILNEVNMDPSITFTVFTGKGDFFCSGSDFNFERLVDEYSNPKARADPPYFNFISQLIDHSKILIGLVNGPAIGIGVTLLAHFDMIVASDRAYFTTPFTQLGLAVEAASSETFPRLLGRTVANRLLLFSEKLSAVEMKQIGFVSHVFPHSEFQSGVEKILKQCSQLAPESIVQCKERIVHSDVRKELRNAHFEERALLGRRWQSAELMEYMGRVFGKKRPKL